MAEELRNAGVDGQRTADATGIPRLSVTAEAAVGTPAAGRDDHVPGGVWRTMQQIAGGRRTFGAVMGRRFGTEGMCALLRAEERSGVVTAASITPEQRPALDRVAKLTATLEAGERLNASLLQREAESERQAQRRGMRL